MEVKQLFSIVNDVHKQIVGSEEVTEINTSNIVDIGTEIFSATSVDNYVKALTDKIGKQIFNNRSYMGNGLNVLMDTWEFGSVLEKIDVNSPVAVKNDTWDLQDGKAYSQDTFYKPTVTAKFFNSKVTFEIDVSFAEKQVKSSFNSVNDLNAFVSMIYNAVEKSFTVKLDGLIMSTLNNMTAQTIYRDYGDGTGNYKTKSTVKAVNLLKLYNEKFSKTLTSVQALSDIDFLRFATVTINSYVDRMSKMSKLFNIGQKERFTPKEELNLITLSDFKNACLAYLQANTKNMELVALPNSESVPYWQGTGTNYNFDDVSTIKCKIKDESNVEQSVVCTGIIAVMFDKYALGVCNNERRVTTYYNAKGEFFNNFYKFDCSYFNDLNENFVVFIINDKEV